MTQFIIRRLLSAIPVLIGILILTFALARAIPGDPCYAMLGERATVEACERFARDHGLDEPVLVQLAIYMGKIMRGDFGNSIRLGRPVTQLLIERLPMTIELSVAAMIIAVAAGIPAGMISATRHNSIVDVSTMIGANLGISIPVFWLGLMLAYTFALLIPNTLTAIYPNLPPQLTAVLPELTPQSFRLPPSGRLSAGLSAEPFYEVFGWTVEEGTLRFNVLEFFANLYLFNSVITRDWEVFKDAAKHLILPAITLSTIPMAIIARMTRSSLLEVLGLEYVRTARAKGVIERRVVMVHALRNAMLPVVTIIGLSMGALLGGAILTETIFGLAGVGKAMYDAITGRDYTLIQAFVIVIAFIYVVVNMLVDVSYAYLDPRIRLE